LQEFPNIKKVVSYGSNQSNAMYSLSVLAKMKGWEYEYYVNHISSYLVENPHGNYKYAIENGMRLIVSDTKPLREEIENEETVFVEEGGRQEEASIGIRMLADEIKLWQQAKEIPRLNVFLPSGTGTTALFLQKYLLEIDSRFQAKVYTVPCVGDADYLRLQFDMLESNVLKQPTILKPKKKYHFGKLYAESYKIWLKLRQEMGVEFDLLYDPVGWLTLLEHPKIFEEPTLYIHQGGLIGNESMLVRYQRKYGENIK
nr:1-aminocyclopropane-1-carboxylate deaminase/D-cysteine desulfhydrase [Campylobacterota bacterium]